MEVCDGRVGAFEFRAEVSNDALLFEVVPVGSVLRFTFINEVVLVDLLEIGFRTEKAVVSCLQLLDPSL